MAGDRDLRVLVVRALVTTIVDRDDLVAVLIRTLDDGEREVRREATSSLGDLGESAQAAVPALFGLMTEDSDRYAARVALASIGPRDVALLMEKMRHEGPFVRRVACDALNSLGLRAVKAAPLLREFLEDPELREKSKKGQDYGIRRCVESALKKIGKRGAF